MRYQPIENYGVIGDLRTVALVSKSGSIDWMCFPHFDSPAIFGALLDADKGGSWEVIPDLENVTYHQFYWPNTNILITRFMSSEGMAELIDYMPISQDESVIPRMIIRQLKVTRGQIRFKLSCRPAFNYARTPHECVIDDCIATFTTPELKLQLFSPFPLEEDENEHVVTTFEFNAEQSANFILASSELEDNWAYQVDIDQIFETTRLFWQEWIKQSTYKGRWQEMVYRSALTLKLLTFQPTGAFVAAPTASLPENIGGTRNWDYRYNWIRDAAFSLYALLRIGFTSEAAQFMDWLAYRCFDEDGVNGPLKPMYTIQGGPIPEEEILEHLEGYRGSSPVRIGNAAADQFQLDIYGELLDAVYLFNKYGAPISLELWERLCIMLDWLCDNWDQPDDGIWEVRGGRKHFVYSRLMCWVAFDRGLRIADKRSFPGNHTRWLEERDAIYKQIIEKGWNEEIQSFVQFYGTANLDASVLIMPLVFFMAPTDPHMLKTIEAIRHSPEKGGLAFDGLVYRYKPEAHVDGFDEPEGTFNMCSFWLIEALTRAGRFNKLYLEQARFLFEQMLNHCNHLGLFAEETGLHGEALGNFPQAFTHLAFISAAFNLNRALDD